MILFKVLTKNKLTLFGSLFKMFRNLTWQSSVKDIRHYCQPGKNYCSIVLIMLEIVWIFSALILTNSFTGLLLSTFFNIKSTPVVNTLQDIRDNSLIMIQADYQTISRISNDHDFYMDDLLIRIKEKMNFLTTMQKVVELVINGQAVCLHNSLQRKFFIDIASSYIDRILVSDTKYLPGYILFVVRLNNEYTKIVEF